MRYPVYSVPSEDGHSVIIIRKSLSYCDLQCEPKGEEAPYAEWIDSSDKKQGIRLLSVDQRKEWKERKSREADHQSPAYITKEESENNAVGCADKRMRVVTIEELMAMQKVDAYPACFDKKAVRVPGCNPEEFQRAMKRQWVLLRHANN